MNNARADSTRQLANKLLKNVQSTDEPVSENKAQFEI